MKARTAASRNPQDRKIDPLPSRGRGRPVGDRDGKRKELLRAGIATLAELGYSGASLRKVARTAGYTTGAVTYYFKNKEAMTLAILDHLFDEYDQVLDLGEEVDDLKRRISRYLDMSSDGDAWLAQFQLLAQARHEPALAEIYQRRYANYRASLAATLARLQAAGKVRDDITADILADQISGMADGWSIMLPIEPERFASERLERLLDALIRLIKPTNDLRP